MRPQRLAQKRLGIRIDMQTRRVHPKAAMFPSLFDAEAVCVLECYCAGVYLLPLETSRDVGLQLLMVRNF